MKIFAIILMILDIICFCIKLGKDKTIDIGYIAGIIFYLLYLRG